MERLTEKHYRNSDGYYMKCSEGCHLFSCEECERFGEEVDRLGQIEDILGDTYDLDRLRELVEAEKAGRCVVTPCKVGDKIYKLFCGGAVELEVELIVCWLSGRWKVNAHTDRKYTDWEGFEIDFSDFGKTVFLTREVAEAALAKEGDHE